MHTGRIFSYIRHSPQGAQHKSGTATIMENEPQVKTRVFHLSIGSSGHLKLFVTSSSLLTRKDERHRLGPVSQAVFRTSPRNGYMLVNISARTFLARRVPHSFPKSTAGHADSGVKTSTSSETGNVAPRWKSERGECRGKSVSQARGK